jgi:signal transduction histidine kinase/ligand-binding sensor domain-containing protein
MNKAYFWRAILILLLSKFELLPAQTALNFQFHQIKPQDGLTEANNAFITRDSRGFIWLSSLDGVNRFDGHTIKTYLPDEDNPHSVKGEIGQSPFWEDKAGNLWFCTYTALNCYLRKNDHFRSWEVSVKSNVDYSILHLSPSGQLWMMANNQLFNCSTAALLKNEKIAFSPILVQPGVVEDKKFLVQTDAHNELSGFYSYRNFEGRMHFWKKTKQKSFIVRQLFTSQKIRLNFKQIFQDPKQPRYLWCVASEGLYRYDIQSDRILLIALNPFNKGINLNGGVMLNEHTIALTSSKGIIGFDTKSGKFFDLPSASTLKDKQVSDLYLDQNKILWASVYGEGVYFSPLMGRKFEYLKTSGSAITGLAEADDGKVWAAHKNGIVTNLQEKKEIKQYRLSPLAAIQNIKDQGIIALSPQEVFQFPNQTKVWRSIFQSTPNWNLSIYANPQNQNFWLCSSMGIKKFNLSTSPIQISNFDSLGAFRSNAIYDMFYDVLEHKYYLDNNHKEIWVYVQKSGQWKKTHTIPINAIFNHCAPINELNENWIANSKGVLCINRENGKYHWLKNQFGTLRQNINAIEVDKLGKIWLVGNFMVLKYDIKTKTTEQYTWEDGLFAGQFKEGAVLNTRAGEIWIGGEQGINIFNPLKLASNNNVAIGAILECKINDTPIKDQSPNEIKKLQLPWHQNNLFLRLVAIEYSAPQKNKLEYQLRGWEKTSNLAGPIADVKYNRLTPGKYSFWIRAANSNGLWSAWKKKMEIQIRPPFWQTWIFKILATCFSLFLIWGAIQLYIRARLQKERMLSAQKDARIKEQQRILREVHDDLGSSLTGIQQIRRKAVQSHSPEVLTDFEEIYSMSVDLFTRLGALIVNEDGGSISLSQLLQKIERHSRRYLGAQNNLEVDIETPSQLPNLELENDFRLHLELIVKECLHNIVKHAQASQVKIAFHIQEKLIITIFDNGRGIPAKSLENLDSIPNSPRQIQGNGLRNLRLRATELKGTIQWQNLNPGTLVHIEVPFTQII